MSLRRERRTVTVPDLLLPVVVHKERETGSSFFPSLPGSVPEVSLLSLLFFLNSEAEHPLLVLK